MKKKFSLIKIVLESIEETNKNLQQLQDGTFVEREHQPTYDMIVRVLEETGKLPPPEKVFQSIAIDHLNEFKDYYTRLRKMEQEAEREIFENIPYNRCPICGKPAQISCKCRLLDRVCEDGHAWHRCPVHGKTEGRGHDVNWIDRKTKCNCIEEKE